MDNQVLLQNKIETEVTRNISDLLDRMNAVEYVIYKSEEPDTRFSDIYDKLIHMEAARSKDIENSKHLRDNL